jgi:capsular polysaccharide transport system permease protein
MTAIATIRDHSRIIWALMLRELATRYGRDNLGFLWVIFEPLVFCGGVLIMYRAIRGQYMNALEVIPFVMCGYMPTILVRHIVMYSLNAIKINGGLLYHKSISVLDLFVARIILEFIGVTLSFMLIFSVLFAFGLTPFPVNLGLVYEGWFTTGFVGSGLALMVGAISELVDVVERIISVTLYVLVPISGTFFLAEWLPPNVRHYALLLPFLNCSEMIRAGFFGNSINPHYDLGYTLTCALVMTVVGLLIVRHARARAELI